MKIGSCLGVDCSENVLKKMKNCIFHLIGKAAHSNKTIIFRLFVVSISLFGSSITLANAIEIGFIPSTLNMNVGDRQVVQIVVIDIPSPGLAATEFKLNYNAEVIKVENPNELGRASGVTAFAPLTGFICTALRGVSPCPDPPWLLTATSRVVDASTDRIDDINGEVLVGFATRVEPTMSDSNNLPIGSGVIALIEVIATRDGITTVDLPIEDVILADASTIPVKYEDVTTKSLTVNVGGVSNTPPELAPIPDQSVTEGDRLAIPVSATDADGNNVALSVNCTPATPFVTINDNGDGTGSVNVEPAIGDSADYSCSVTAQDDGVPPATSTASAFSLVVLPFVPANEPPILAAIGNQAVNESTALTIPLSSTDSNGDPLVFSASGLPTFAALTDSGDGTGSISVNPGFADAGSYTITVTVADNGSPVLSDAETLTLTVNDINQAPVLAPIGNQSVAEGGGLSVAINASDADADNVSFSATGLPAFASLTDNGDGTASLAINPSFTDAGTYTVTVSVTDDGTPALGDSETIEIVVGGTNQAPVLEAIGNQRADEGTSLTLGLTANDADGDTLALSATGLPAFASLTDNGDGTGSISVNPDFADAGSYTITVTVADNGSPVLSDTQTLTLTVSDINQAPVLAPIGNQSVAEGGGLSVAISASDADANNVSFSATGLPAFASLTDNGDGTASLAVNPSFTDAGTYTVTVSVTDDGTPALGDSETLDIVVGGTNQAPVLDAVGNQNVDEGASLSIGLTANDADGDTLVLSATGLPAFASLIDNGDGTGSISVNPGFADAGSYTITVTVADNGSPVLSDAQTLTLTVSDINQAPVLAPIGNQAGAEGGSLTVAISANDADANNVSFSATGLPAFASLTDNGDGTASLAINPSFTDAGTYSATINATDDGTPALGDSETIEIVVGGTNQTPVLEVIGNQRADEDASLSIGLTANDADGDTLALSATGLPAFASLIDNGDGTGSISVNPGFADAGSYTITVTVADNGSPVLSDAETLTLTVNDINQAPVLAPIGNQSVAEGGGLSVAINASDADADNVSFSATGLPAFASLTDNGDGTASLAINPSFTDAGTYTVTVSVTDDGTPALGDSETIEIVVGGTNQAPVLEAIGNQRADEGTSLTLGLTANDADGDTLALSATGLPAFASLTDNGDGTGSISVNPDFADAGSYTITVTVADNGSPVLSDTQTLTLTVSDINQAPVLAPIGNQSVAEGGGLSVAISASDADANNVSFSATGLPAFASLTDNGDGTASLAVNPSFTDAGTYTVTVSVTDDGTPALGDSETLDIVVGGTNQAPVLDAVGNQNVDEGASLSIGLTANDADGDTLVLSATGLPAFASLIDNGDGTGSISVNPGFADAGSYTITVTVSDNGTPLLSDNESITLTVNDVNRAPVLEPVNIPPINEGDSVTVAVVASDADGDSLSFSATGLPDFTVMIDNRDGTASLQIDPALGSAGSYAITICVTDDGTSSLIICETISIIVGDINQSPVLAPIGDQSVAEGDSISVVLSASDVDGDNLAFNAVGLPSFATFSDNGDGTAVLSVTPGFDDSGSYPVTITVTDDGEPALSANESFNIVVIDTNRAPKADAGVDRNVITGDPATLDGSASFDPDGDAITFAWRFMSLPAASGLTSADIANANTPAASFIPDVDGDYVVALEVSDAELMDEAIVTITATTPPNISPNADAGGNQTVDSASFVVLDGSASNDPDSSPLPLTFSWSFVSVPTGSSLTNAQLVDATMTIAGFTPDIAGEYVVRLDVFDGTSTASATAAITASSTNIPPTANAGADQIATLGDTVALDGSASNDSDFGPAALSFTWTFASIPSGSTLTDTDIIGANAATPSYLPDVPGAYLLRLDVFDGVDGDFDQVMVEVGATPAVPVNLAGRAKLLHVNVVWDASEGATNYIVFRKLDTEADFVEIGITEAAVYVDDLRTGATSADYFVQAQNVFGVSDDSEIITVLSTSRSR